MPKGFERRLRRQAKQKGITSKKRQDAYVYGTMRKTGWRPRKRGKR